MSKDNKKQFDKPSNILILANKYIKLISLLFIIFTLAFGYLFLLQPKIDLIKSTKQNELPEIEKKEDDLRELITKLSKLKTKYNNIKSQRTSDLEKLYKIVPDNPDIANIFLISDRLANQYGFQLLSIDITEESNRGNKKDKEEVVKSGLQSLIIHMTVAQVDNGDDAYNKFKEYLGGLENNLRLMDIQTVSFEGFSENEEEYSIFNFSIITYFNNQGNE